MRTASVSKQIIFTFILCMFAFLSPPLYASDGIQMMPPTDFADPPQPCKGATSGLLQWDGTNPIKCVAGASGDSNGNIVANGTIKPGSNGITTGASCLTEGALAYDLVLHQPVYCNSTLVWSAIGYEQPGSWCGMAAIPSYSCLGGETCDNDYPALWVDGAYPPEGGVVIMCHSNNPAVSCPSGYKRLLFAYLGWNGPPQHQADDVAVCVKQ